MAQGQLHLRSDGPSPCHAKTDDGCPFSGEGHYDTALEAETAYAEKMVKEGFSVIATKSRADEIEEAREEYSSDYYENSIRLSGGARVDDPSGITTQEDLDKFRKLAEKSKYYRENDLELQKAFNNMEDSISEFEEDGLEPDDEGSYVYLSIRQKYHMEKLGEKIADSIRNEAKRNESKLSNRLKATQQIVKQNNDK